MNGSVVLVFIAGMIVAFVVGYQTGLYKRPAIEQAANEQKGLSRIGWHDPIPINDQVALEAAGGGHYITARFELSPEVLAQVEQVEGVANAYQQDRYKIFVGKASLFSPQELATALRPVFE